MKNLPIPKPKAKPLPSSAKKKKIFTVEPWTGEGEGEKIIEYADSGMGKTTLASLAPNPVFVGIDDGGRKIRHPITGEPLNRVPEVKTYDDVRAVLQSPEVFENYETVVVDTVTELEKLALPFVFRTVPGPKGAVVQNIEGYGYNKGYRHLWDAMHKILVATDCLIKAGKNVIFIAQSQPERVANPSGDDFLRDAPDLYSGKPSNVAQFVAWADHVLKIDYEFVNVEEKKADAVTNRVIRVHPEVYYIAKSRTIPVEYKTVPFANTQDDSIWRLVFNDS